MANYGITILGTGGDPQVVGRQLRASGGFVLTTHSSQIHIDPGPGALVQLAKQELHPRETTAIVLTHQHVNHVSEAAAIISAMTHNGIDRKGVLLTNTVDECLVPAFHRTLVERTMALTPGLKIAVNDVEITAVKAKHYDANAVGLIIHAPEYVVGYTSDTAYTDEIAEQYKGVNILIVNCKHPAGVHEGDHLNTEDVAQLLVKVKPQLAVITHFGAKLLAMDPIAQARNIQYESRVQVVAAKDGLHIAPASYDAKRKQTSLKGF